MQSLSLNNLNVEEKHSMNDNVEEEDDPSLRYNRSLHVEPFHRQRRIDGTLPFSEQIPTMNHIVVTNSYDGRYVINDNLTGTDLNQGGIWKEIIHNGIGQKPTVTASVRLHYYAYFEHRDEPFDTSFKRRRPLEFRLGKFEVLPGIDLAVSTMQRRERAKFIISSDLLYGELGCAPHIPESAWCLYVIELLTTNESSTVVHDDQLLIKTTINKQQIDDFAKRIRLAQTLRNTGNEEYANGQLDRALRSYNKARQLIHNKVTLIDGKQEEQYHQLLLKLHLNSAQCYLRLDNYEKCFRACRDTLIIEPNNLKALFRASVSLRSLNQLDAAEKYISKALSIDPQNRDILMEVIKLKEALDSAMQATIQKPDELFTLKDSLSNNC
ncbi:unnamed protein product [Rotaria magnacalcarata]|uniref:peptidylprolyl isomerase n=1 Tax=Rotaria magnacalcarata TaxID=392030 RepID=A0A816AHP4_9BILA|nr:unnamed protein product [Rotaria magnacalcarata]CAF1595732.1 unnamed protein product [Rotaria magnacalcarata]CAF2037757.1 unnamed protein product [Rotaria magnacalcarata]CAF2109010.1 unnamed protein product [Rotaria magnacalcarata]CAF2120665.1 unnamed protein product [Rotaria magnacalcarata]